MQRADGLSDGLVAHHTLDFEMAEGFNEELDIPHVSIDGFEQQQQEEYPGLERADGLQAPAWEISERSSAN
jgi:hypothetical protein